ncbi:hypothetical protein CEUSTIGMA_g7194.t1 [Chlamydomonas eustigma]|uniref:Uncharacterized protein n=1 Tax=Chlamydomonas eustigma TaxID=1157962 RepID=A0A250X9H9_9CHLO|nr:hypothetical protein CEUSTIGMA_g7194.t1 [Chlamydomonas eustigma]|eukprot:GAX79753.1 hypothetical protein CEUSTIGMA_g7194.t1 [Chlamydomonas eustigma]
MWLVAFFYIVFLLVLLCHVIPKWRMFTRRQARRHRIAGFLLLLWLISGGLELAIYRASPTIPPILYQTILGALGLATTLTAASDFSSHRKIRNPASGALDVQATITVYEMVEHSFYQGLNLVQILYLHALQLLTCCESRYHMSLKLCLLMLATAPWLVRSRFPINRFSANYRDSRSASTLIGVLYRMKKYQYLLYKHALLHGLNVTLALSRASCSENVTLATASGLKVSLPNSMDFRLYWISLNAAYVLEFFLQTLVKRGYMKQGVMLCLNQLLMVASTAPALWVLKHVSAYIAATSFVLNLLFGKGRGNDFVNVMLLLLPSYFLISF